TLSNPERHDHGAASLPAAINRPPGVLPVQGKLRRVYSQTTSNQKQGLNHENLQIIYCIRNRLLCTFTEDARRRATALRGLSQFHHCCRGPRPSGSHLGRWEHSNWYVFVV